MKDLEENHFANYLNKAKKRVKEFVLEKEQLYSKLKNYIITFQSFDSEICSTLLDAREFYSRKRYDYNLKLLDLKKKKDDYERLWRDLTKKVENFPKPKVNKNSLVLIRYTKKALEDIQNKITILNSRLEEQNLDIDEEADMIEELKNLEIEKQNKVKNLTNIEQKQRKELQSSDYYNTQRKIKSLEDDLTDIYEDLMKMLDKRSMTHKKILDLYKKAKEFDKIKKEFESELIENKTSSDAFHQLFLKLMNLNKKVLLDELPNRLTSRVRPKERKKPDVKRIIKKKKKYKKLEQKKLEIALEKQKSGKKLDFYEYQLILKHSKK
jgi:hypothetical protein